MKKNIFALAILMALIGWQCSKIDSTSRKLSLKESLETSVAELNNAISIISSTKGYQLLSVSAEGVKQDDSFKDSITLDIIAGIYDYQPDPHPCNHFYFPYKLFTKTGESDMLIVNLPHKMIFRPKYLHNCSCNDEVMENNFTITASDYHFYYTWWNQFDYKLDAGFTLDSEDIGYLLMLVSGGASNGFSQSTKFTFTEGYSVMSEVQTGDTTKMVFALAEDDDTLMAETVMHVGNGFKRKERLYILSIGNVDIKRGTRIDSIQVFLDGVLQENAAVKIIDTTEYNNSVCYKRDILLTFDDGTTAKLSELLKPSRDILKTLFRSLGEMYLAKHIVDYIAFCIYYHSI